MDSVFLFMLLQFCRVKEDWGSKSLRPCSIPIKIPEEKGFQILLSLTKGALGALLGILFLNY